MQASKHKDGMTSTTASLPAGLSRDDKRWLWLLAAALGLLLVVRVAALWLNGTDLFFDEAQYWTWSREPAFGYYSKPPLIAWAIGATTAVCGSTEPCVRLSSPILHTATALAVAALGARLYDRRTGALAGLVFATLPGVSLSAGIVSTDVPLLLFWALALLGFDALQSSRGWSSALLLGVSFGLGLNAKYAMAWFLVSAAIYFWLTPDARRLLKDARLWLALALGFMILVPNIVWNAQHSFATVGHTAENANWQGVPFHPLKALEFVGAQFGVFGPILFGALLVITWRAARQTAPPPDRLLLAFTWPVLAIIIVQAFLSRAHANWAAVSYVAATLLVTATMIRNLDWRWLNASLALHFALVVAIAAAAALAGRVGLPLEAEPFQRTLGWHALADVTRAELTKARAAGRPYAAVLTDDRALTAELLYYMQGEPTPVEAWREGPRPHDHYELTRPYTGARPGPVLLVALKPDPTSILAAFNHVDAIGQRTLSAGRNATRRITLYALSGLKPTETKRS